MLDGLGLVLGSVFGNGLISDGLELKKHLVDLLLDGFVVFLGEDLLKVVEGIIFESIGAEDEINVSCVQ